MLEQPHFGRRLRRLRLERGMSQAGLVGEGLSTAYLSRLESGERPPTERAVAYLAQRLGVEESALAGPSERRSLTEVLAAVASAPSGTDETAALSQAVEADTGEDPAARWQALWLLSRAAGRDGDHESERVRLLEAIELSDLLQAAELRARSHAQYARCLCALGDMCSAEPAAREALSIARAEQLPVSDTVAALMVLISIETELGRLETAGRHVHELERDLLPGAGPAQAAEALWTAAVVSSRQGDHATARSRLEQALHLPQRRPDVAFWARLRAAATAAALQMSPPHVDAAERWLSEAASVLAVIGTPLQRQELRALQAHLAFHKGELDEARELSHGLLSEGDLRLSYRDKVRLSALDGRLMILAGSVDDGIATLQELGRQAADSKNLDLSAHIWQALATTLADVHAASNTGESARASAGAG
ncbi:helix-turn-helix domain-containing protein [Streptomyces apricus]|uniref:Helix-turn-helix domain-containing protein n=1 Tax=Streptomyces apricus TaxID=1828112 RepID=A0A5B0A4J2_9ACTN|nr:helix-turn-helix domain-containing protein [Streptomyces apricus]KAA0924111.1 helix-turn-helix domain-containing protein [Streptomyces apricus]